MDENNSPLPRPRSEFRRCLSHLNPLRGSSSVTRAHARHGTADAVENPVRHGTRPGFWSVRDGRKVQKSFPTPAAARGWRRDALSAVAGGKLRASTSERWPTRHARGSSGSSAGRSATRGGRPYKPAVLRLYRRDVETYIVKELGGVKVSQLRRRDVQASSMSSSDTVCREAVSAASSTRSVRC